jgi:AcrR family transcriptional regulator
MMDVGADRMDGRRAKGDASRRVALTHARAIALVEGLEGLTFGRVAKESGMAKSSLQILFGDRETLQRQTLETGVQEFAEDVARIVQQAEGRESRPLQTLCDAWFTIAGTRDCGGCLLTKAVAEFSARSGPISDAVKEIFGRWRKALRDAADSGVASGELRPDADVDQLVFEILALQAAANSRIEVADETATERAARAVRKRLAHGG